jgi:hypothetical protein
MSNLKARVLKEITKGTERDKQRRAGPSNIANPCPRCVGQSLAGVEDNRDFSLYPFIGTAVHAYLEHNTFPAAKHELKLIVGEVHGYGTIKGTTDLYLAPSEDFPDDATVLDWKIVGIKKIKSYIVNGPPEQYRYQANIYARGLELAGEPVDKIAICFIPRDSGNVNDIWIFEEEYRPEMAEAALNRAGIIYEIVQNEGWETLPSDSDCYQCNSIW